MKISVAAEKDLDVVNKIFESWDFLKNYGFIHEFDEDEDQILKFLTETKKILENLINNPIQTLMESDLHSEVVEINSGENNDPLKSLVENLENTKNDKVFFFYADVYDQVPNFDWPKIWEKIAKNTIESLLAEKYEVRWMTGGYLGKFPVE